MSDRLLFAALAILMSAGCTSRPPAREPLPLVRDCSDANVVPARGTTIVSAATAVIDGDSFCLGEIEIRLRDFNAPEWDEPGGAEARARLADLLGSAGQVTCEIKARSYDRALGVCRLADGAPLRDRLGVVP